MVTGESPGVRQIEFDNHDNLWLPTFNGLYKFNPVSQQLILFQEGSNSPFSISGTNVRSVEYLGDDLLLVGTQQGGLDLLVNYGCLDYIFFRWKDSVVGVSSSFKARVSIMPWIQPRTCLLISSALAYLRELDGI